LNEQRSPVREAGAKVSNALMSITGSFIIKDGCPPHLKTQGCFFKRPNASCAEEERTKGDRGGIPESLAKIVVTSNILPNAPPHPGFRQQTRGSKLKLT